MKEKATPTPDLSIAALEKAKREQVRADRLKAALQGNIGRRKAKAKQGADDKASEKE